MKHTKEIFEPLSRGGFISSNSVRQSVKRLYEAIEDEYEQYREYFEGIGFTLEAGNGYYYFTRMETKVELADKLVDDLEKAGFIELENELDGNVHFIGTQGGGGQV